MTEKKQPHVSVFKHSQTGELLFVTTGFDGNWTLEEFRNLFYKVIRARLDAGDVPTPRDIEGKPR